MHSTTYLVDITEVARHDLDGPIVVFAKNPTLPRKTRDWWYAHATMDAVPDLRALDGFEEMQREFLARLVPEERLASLTPEERLAGLTPEQVVLAIPIEILREFPDAFIAALPDDEQRTVRERLAR